MPRLTEVIEPREFFDESFQWYRRIGKGRYRFRVKRRNDGSTLIIVHKAGANRNWPLVHEIELRKGH